MDFKIQTWLLDIEESIDQIHDFIGDENNFIKYKNDLKTKKAVERNLEIIGEAVNRILKQDAEFSLSNAKSIIGTRNRIIHSYDNLSDEIIWTVITRDLPLLKAEISELLKS